MFEDVGLFDAQLKSCGDSEWGERVFASGYKQIYVNDACVAHPARSSFKEISKKAVRITRGIYELNRRQDASFSVFWQDLSYDLKPPFRSFFQIWSDKRLHNIQNKLEFAIAMLLVKYVTAWVKIQQRLKEVRTREPSLTFRVIRTLSK